MGKAIGLEVNNEDVDELEDHITELTTEKLHRLHDQQQQKMEEIPLKRAGRQRKHFRC